LVNAHFEHRLKDFSAEKIQNDDYKLNCFIKDKYVEKKWAKKKKQDPASLIAQGKPLEEEEKEEKTEEESPKPTESKPHQSQQQKFQKLNFNGAGTEKQKPSKSSEGGKSVSLIDFNGNGNENGKNKIDFQEFEEAPSQSSSTTSTKFAFINKSNGNGNNQNSLIDLNSSENIKDVRFKEATDGIFKLFTQEEVPVNNSPNKGAPIYNGYPNNNNVNQFVNPNMNNNGNYQQQNGGFTNGYNNGYQNGYGYNGYQQNYNNNLHRNNFSAPMSMNTNVQSSDLFNKSSSYESGNKMNSNFNISNIDLTTLKVQGKEKNPDPFKNLVNFK